MKVILQPAGIEDIPKIYKLAEEIWNDHYVSIIGKEQVDYMLDKFYSPAYMLKSMNAGEKYYLILYGKNLIGYLAFSALKNGEWFMNKFYLKQNNQRSGLGTEALRIWEEMTSPNLLRLQVNRKNYKSINFYFKNGFYIHDIGDFDIGNGFSMDDFIMIKNYKTKK